MSTEEETILKCAKPETEIQLNPPAITDELSQVNQATKALVDALKGLAQVKIQSANDLTAETHQNIDRSVQVLRDKADRSWHNAIDQVEDIDDRVTKAAKAAWEVLTAPSSKS
jgi:transcription initiation factor IIF auxiliary subunit